jgi:hypothetical protein
MPDWLAMFLGAFIGASICTTMIFGVSCLMQAIEENRRGR